MLEVDFLPSSKAQAGDRTGQQVEKSQRTGLEVKVDGTPSTGHWNWPEEKEEEKKEEHKQVEKEIGLCHPATLLSTPSGLYPSHLLSGWRRWSILCPRKGPWLGLGSLRAEVCWPSHSWLRSEWDWGRDLLMGLQPLNGRLDKRHKSKTSLQFELNALWWQLHKIVNTYW